VPVVVRVPNSEQLARPYFFRHQFHPSVVPVANHEFKGVDVALKKPTQRQAARTNRTQDLAEDKPVSPAPPNFTGNTAARSPDSCKEPTSAAGKAPSSSYSPARANAVSATSRADRCKRRLRIDARSSEREMTSADAGLRSTRSCFAFSEASLASPNALLLSRLDVFADA
jgi:hypothetical protein